MLSAALSVVHVHVYLICIQLLKSQEHIESLKTMDHQSNVNYNPDFDNFIHQKFA